MTATQLNMFAAPKVEPTERPAIGHHMGPYQREGVDAAFREFLKVRSTLEEIP